VKPYVKRQKNDATDAEAICEAVTRANMRFVPTKTPEQQSGLVKLRPWTPSRRRASAEPWPPTVVPGLRGPQSC
jgi:transposase